MKGFICFLTFIAEEDRWGTIFPQCNGHEQSPMDFWTNVIKLDKSLQPFDLLRFKNTRDIKMVLSNDGHSGKTQYVVT